jgi:hypothetical protein
MDYDWLESALKDMPIELGPNCMTMDRNGRLLFTKTFFLRNANSLLLKLKESIEGHNNFCVRRICHFKVKGLIPNLSDHSDGYRVEYWAWN